MFSFDSFTARSIPEALILAILTLVVIIISGNDLGVDAQPVIKDPNLVVELVSKGINIPTNMAFLGPDDILVLEKNNGTVRQIVNGNMDDEPLLDVNVANKQYRGMLGIAISKNATKDATYVFLYYTESGGGKDGEDLQGEGLLGNRLYRYELKNNKLMDPKLLLDVPVKTGADHTGGAVLVGPDQYVYLVMGDGGQFNKAQNVLSGIDPVGTSTITRITQDGMAIQDDNNLGGKDPLNKYYAYGIRNSFGMDFDPVTGNLWDTENGRDCCDEVNLVEPGFNSGWRQVQGIWEINETKDRVGIFNQSEGGKLVNFDGKGRYSSPEFIWNETVCPSALKFFNSNKFGEDFKNDLFVGDYKNGYLYHFDLIENRTELDLHGKLKDKIANTSKELPDIVFGEGFGGITDIEVGPDGNLYILSHSSNDENNLSNGSIFKISKSNN